MNVCVTGGAGFIGSHLVARLVNEGYSVTILDDFNDFYNPGIKRANVRAFRGEIEIFEGNILDADLVNRVFSAREFDAVVHLAAKAGVRPSIQDPTGYIATNINGTFNLLEAAKRAKVPKFVFASSSSVYGLAKEVPFSEQMALPQTLSPYAATKLSGEHLCGNYSHLYGLSVVCLRFFTVYGAGQRPDLAIHKFTRLIDQGLPVPKYGDGSTRRDYTYIDDIIQGVCGAIRYVGSPFEIINLGESETTTLSELIEALERALNKKAIIKQLPEQMGDMPLTCADITKAKSLLGYNPKTKLSEGLPKFVQWYLEHRSLSASRQ